MNTGSCNALGMRLGTVHLYSLLYERGARRGLLCVSSEHIGTLGMDWEGVSFSQPKIVV